MDCSEPIDDYCHAWPTDDRQVPGDLPRNNSDQFFISFELEVTYPLEDEDEDEDEEIDDNPFVRVESNDCFTMWAPCPRLASGNLPRDAVSRMLSNVGVPVHKQEFMIDRISSLADAIANDAGNRNRRVLPMHVFVSIVACLCYGETVDDPDRPMD